MHFCHFDFLWTHSGVSPENYFLSNLGWIHLNIKWYNISKKGRKVPKTNKDYVVFFFIPATIIICCFIVFIQAKKERKKEKTQAIRGTPAERGDVLSDGTETTLMRALLYVLLTTVRTLVVWNTRARCTEADLAPVAGGSFLLAIVCHVNGCKNIIGPRHPWQAAATRTCCHRREDGCSHKSAEESVRTMPLHTATSWQETPGVPGSPTASFTRFSAPSHVYH